MKSTTLGPSLTAPKSSTTRGELRTLHALTSSRLKRPSGTWDQRTSCNLERARRPRRVAPLTLLAAHVNPVAASRTQKTSP